MNRNEMPYIPPTCPAYRAGEGFDITPDKFVLYVGEVDENEKGRPTRMEVEGVFYSNFYANDLPDVVATAIVDESIDSPFATSARYLHPGAHTAPHKLLGEVFCERIKNCRGITEQGECWALGRRGVIEAIQQYDKERSG